MRTRSTGVISSSRVRIGLIFSAEPIQALAPPIRPPRRRYSRVSIANHIFSSSRVCWARASAASASLPPAAAAAAAERAEAHPTGGRPRVEEVDALAALALVDQLRSRAWPAASKVPEIPAEMWIEAISRPSSSSGS